MTTAQEILAARLMGKVADNDFRLIDDKVFVRLEGIRITKDTVTLVAVGGLSCALPFRDLRSRLLDDGTIEIRTPSAFIEANLK